MRTANINLKANYMRLDLIDHLQKNREKHIKDYNEAVDAYKEAWIAAIETQLHKIENGEMPVPYISMTMPINETKSYDNLINNFNQMTNDEIELSLEDANKIINDEWDWAQAAFASNSTYKIASPR